MKMSGVPAYLIPSVVLAAVLAPACASAQTVDGWEERANARQPPARVMDIIGVRPGMVIGEVGAGGGRYTVHLAMRVGDQGRVIANDISQAALDRLRDRCTRDRIRNVDIVLGRVDDPRLPSAALDMAIMVWVYHHLDQPVSLLRNLKTSLKPGATVVILDPDPERGGERDSDRPSTDDRVRREAGEAGFDLVRVDRSLPNDSIFILKARLP